MTADTKQLIRDLTKSVPAVRHTPRPWVRAILWLALSVAYIGIFVLVMPRRHQAAPDAINDLFLLEQFAASATGLTAAIAAFASVVPGYNRRWITLPILPLVVWLASLGPGCLQQLRQFGIADLPLRHDPLCVPFVIFLGALPGVAIAMMLRRGAPLTPHLTAALGGLAAAGLANIGLRIIHPEDVSVMLLVWHIGGVMVLSALAAGSGRYFLNWPSLIKKSKLHDASESIGR